MMQLSEIKELLSCNVFCGEEFLSREIQFGCASDLMSDVLAYSRAGAVLMTGLANIQTIHTAFIAEIEAIVFVRGRKPDDRMIEAAISKKLPLLGCGYSMYESCGILYAQGLVSTMEVLDANLKDG